MSLNPNTIDALAQRIEAAQRDAQTLSKLTLEFPDLDMADAYAVQDALRARYLARGDRLVGYKCGLTSKAKMVQMGVDQPGYGFLTAGMWCPDGSASLPGTTPRPPLPRSAPTSTSGIQAVKQRVVRSSFTGTSRCR